MSDLSANNLFASISTQQTIEFVHQMEIVHLQICVYVIVHGRDWNAKYQSVLVKMQPMKMLVMVTENVSAQILATVLRAM